MKKVHRLLFYICILGVLSVNLLGAQHGMSRRRHSSRDESVQEDRRRQAADGFYIEKLYYTIDENVIKLNIYFNNSINPDSLAKETIQFSKGGNPLDIQLIYNRSGDQVQINAVFPLERDLNSLGIDLKEVQSFRGASLEISSFDTLNPNTIYEYTREGQCHVY